MEKQQQLNDYKCWGVCISYNDKYCIASLSKRIRNNSEVDNQKSILKVMNIEEQKVINKLELLEIEQQILIVECHPQMENICVSGDLDGNVVIWDIILGVALNIFKENNDHINNPWTNNLIYDGRFSHDGQTFAVSTYYGSFSIYGNQDPDFY